MKCDSQASLLACTFASPCLGRKSKARVVIVSEEKMFKDIELIKKFVVDWKK